MGARTGELKVDGATLHWQLRGEGPGLLVLQGGDGDASGSDGLAAELEGRFTVLTFDRRGLSRSAVEPGQPPPTLETHAADAHRLLAELTQAPANVLGISIGGSIGLALLAAHPDRVRRFVCHEAPVTSLLPEAERAPAVAAQEEVERLYRTQGPGAAMRHFFALAGVDLRDAKPGLRLPAPNPQRLKNIDFFLRFDAPAARDFHPRLEELRASAGQLVVGIGEKSGDAVPARCARALAEALGLPLTAFPGAHNGHVFRPRAFAARLAEVLG